ncbi:MAG TPA: ABC transporter permease [Acidimicrobiales bacterium]|nr:ABC transporter permease [Acidimicrobiales bacterium]
MPNDPLLTLATDALPEPSPPPAPAARSPWRSVARTVGLYAITIWAVVTIVFLLPRAIPGDPLQHLDDPDSGAFVEDSRSRELAMAYYGLDRPLLDQYRLYLSGLVDGDLGWSISQRAPVGELIGRRLPWTLLLVGSSMLLASAVSFVAGVSAAWRRGSVTDKALIVSLAGTRAVPEYAIASALLILFAVTWPVLPMAGGQTAFARYPNGWEAAKDVFNHLVLPMSSLTLGLAANQFLIVRNSAISTLGEDYMLLARAKGLPPRLLKYRHSGRNVLLPFLTAFGVQVGFAVSASLFVEKVFSYPGIGTLIDSAVTARDYPLLQGLFVMLALVVIAANFLVDLAYKWVDPRVA